MILKYYQRLDVFLLFHVRLINCNRHANDKQSLGLDRENVSVSQEKQPSLVCMHTLHRLSDIKYDILVVLLAHYFRIRATDIVLTIIFLKIQPLKHFTTTTPILTLIPMYTRLSSGCAYIRSLKGDLIIGIVGGEGLFKQSCYLR
jgi:hypothetical protein